MAATQGVYRRVNTRKLMAVTGVKTEARAAPSCSMEVPRRTLIVLTTVSFAVNPVINAVDTLQSSKPRGAKIGAIALPITARRLLPLSVTRFSRISKVCKNQMITVATKIIEKALCTKSFALSHIRRSTLFREGNL